MLNTIYNKFGTNIKTGYLIKLINIFKLYINNLHQFSINL